MLVILKSISLGPQTRKYSLTVTCNPSKMLIETT